MAKKSDLALFKDKKALAAKLASTGQQLNDFDLSGERIALDFSGLRMAGCNFSNCVLTGSSFRNVPLHMCTFTGSDWSGCDFGGASFNGGQLGQIKRLDEALNLHTAKFAGTSTEFETAERSRLMWLDWERLGTVGKLPLFGVSTTALVAMPLYYYFLANYNHSLNVMKNSIGDALPGAAMSPVAAALAKLPPLHIPSLSLVALTSALFLALGSLLYAFFGPPLPKQFSLAQWQFQLQQPTAPYLVQSWSKRGLRVFCALCYLIGGLSGVFTLSVKLYQTAKYIWQG